MSNLWQDIRYGARMLWKHRLATLVCATALALGIGANTAMFSLAEAFLAHPVPIENADRIVALVDSRPGQDIDRTPVAPATYFDWRQQAHSFDELGIYAWREVNLTGDRWLFVLAGLRRGVSYTQGAAEMQGIAQRK